MSETAKKPAVAWDQDTKNKFDKLLEKIPIFLRGVAETKVVNRAESLVRESHRSLVFEKDLVDAFFDVTPYGFHGPLKNDMQELGIDYIQYGHPE